MVHNFLTETTKTLELLLTNNGLVFSTVAFAEVPRRQQVRHEEDDRAGPPGRRPAHGQRLAAQVRPPGRREARVLHPDAHPDHHLHGPSGWYIVWWCFV